MSLNPSAVLACAHVAKSVIQPPPSSSVHLPDLRSGGNPTNFPSALHWLDADKQKNPVPEVQSMPPHLQTTRAAAGCGCVAPDVSAQGVGVWLQVVVLPASHTMPVSEEQSFPVPQTHVGEEACGLEPSWGSQAGAVAVHRQERPSYPQSREDPV